MPTVVSYPRSHAYRMQKDGKPGEGKLWNKTMRRWDEPSSKEREQLIRYKVDATLAGHVTVQQRAQRLGQAMDGNTMRWLGTYLYATQLSISSTYVPAVRKRKHRQQIPEETPVILDHEEVHHHQACAVVEQLISMDLQKNFTPHK